MKNDDLIYEHILKPIQTDRRVWAVGGGIVAALIFLVVIWPSKTEVVKAVVKHEVTESETYQTLAKDLAELHRNLEEQVDKAKQTFPERIEALTEKADEVINNAKLDDELAFYAKLINADELEKLDRRWSKTKEATANQYAFLDSIATPYGDNEPNDIEAFYQKGLNYVMNDSNTPGIITEWEARWISVLFEAKRGYLAKQKLQARKSKFLEKYKR